MVAVAGVLIGGIARGTGLQGPVIRQRTAGDHQPLCRFDPFALNPCLHPALDQSDLHWPFLPVTHRQLYPRIGSEGLSPRCHRLPRGALGRRPRPEYAGNGASRSRIVMVQGTPNT